MKTQRLDIVTLTGRSARIAAVATACVMLGAAATGCGAREDLGSLRARVELLEAQAAQAAQAAHTGDLESRVIALESTADQTLAQMSSFEDHLRSTLSELNLAILRLTERLNDLPRPDLVVAAPQRQVPDPQVVYSVPVSGSPFRGPADAKVTMVMAFEFACPFCERVRGTLDDLVQMYGKDLRIVYKHLIVHPSTATIPAQAACAAHRQKRFFEMEKAIWERGFLNNRDLSAANMEAIAQDLGLDVKRFVRDMNGPECARRVTDDQASLQRVGARGTPSFFVNGRFMSGARPLAHFKALIDEELEKANEVIKKRRIRQRNYYQHIVKTGKTSL